MLDCTKVRLILHSAGPCAVFAYYCCGSRQMAWRIDALSKVLPIKGFLSVVLPLKRIWITPVDKRGFKNGTI